MFAFLSGGRNDQNQSVWNFELYLLEFFCYLIFIIWCLLLDVMKICINQTYWGK